MRSPSFVHVVVGLAAAGLAWPLLAAGPGSGTGPIRLPGLKAAAEVTRDVDGIAHIRASNDDDLYFLQGYVHAQDRLFQMDVARRRASGTLAELLGAAALPSDVELRTIGIRRAAERSLAVVSPESRAALEAYARGVNAYVAGASALPPEYAALELTRFQPWTALDGMTVAKSISFSLSFGLEDIDNTIALQTYVAVFGQQAGEALFSQDLWRSQPFSSASTVPDAQQHLTASATAQAGVPLGNAGDGRNAAALAKRYAQRVRHLPFFKDRMGRDQRPASNQWAVAGWRSVSGRPMVANDPHLALTLPSTFYPIHLDGGAGNEAMGNSFAGAPFVVVGQTRQIAWGATVSPLDVTDVYQEQVVPYPTPSGLATRHGNQFEPVIKIDQTYSVNQIGDGRSDNLDPVPASASVPAFTLIVPRRNHGPIVELDVATGTALSVQYTGFSGTRELDALRLWNRARNLTDFKRGLPFFDSGTQNLAYADIDGNIAYFAASEVPLREDLQAGTRPAVPPWFIRDGQGGHEWLPQPVRPADQAIPYRILPASEMPQLVNPPAGWFVNANNDPAGTVLDNDPLNTTRPGGGLYYLNPGYDAGLRAGRITQLIRAKLAQGPLSFADMQAIQADVVLPDAATFVPYVLQAFARADGVQTGDPAALQALRDLATRSRMQNARTRLAAWSGAAPTGIAEGFDASDVNGMPGQPSAQEVADSVATTLYTVWRAEFIANTIDATLNGVPLPPGVSLPKPGSDLTLTALKNLLQRQVPGVGASGLNFFNVPGVASAADRRDILLLKSLDDALGKLAGPAFAAAFSGSTDLDSYRWGRLHRVVFKHPLGAPFVDLPAVHPLGTALPGYPADGGYGTVDVAGFDIRARSADGYMFSHGAVNRFVGEGVRSGMRAESAWPGGTSGVLGSPFYGNLLPRYLTNDTVPLRMRPGDLAQATFSTTRFVP